MHGLGNDFVVLDFLEQAQPLTSEHIRFMADRHFGIGCDQILIIEPATLADADVLYRIYNADGDEVEQCGNGARCIAAYLCERHQVSKDTITAETTTGVIHLYNEDKGHVRVDMGVPDFSPSTIGLNRSQPEDIYSLSIDGHNISMSALSMGNPHAVIAVENTAEYPVTSIAPQIQQDSLFQNGVNVGFMQILDQKTIKLRVFERGVGETLACGTGACAAMVAGRVNFSLEDRVEVRLPGGSLEIQWGGPDQVVWMTGPATFVYEGVITL